ncbi:hypothetical protein ACLOJK_020612 [Asimina triloba]
MQSVTLSAPLHPTEELVEFDHGEVLKQEKPPHKRKACVAAESWKHLMDRIFNLQALQRRILKEIENFSVKEVSGMGEFRLDRDLEERLMGADPDLLAFHKQVPISQVIQFLGVQPIVDSVVSAKRIHLIDLGLRLGAQWSIVMKALEGRSSCSVELLKLSAVGTSEEKIKKVGQQLVSFAENLKLPFIFKAVIVSDMKDIREDLFEIESGEAAAKGMERDVMEELRNRRLRARAWDKTLAGFLTYISAQLESSEKRGTQHFNQHVSNTQHSGLHTSHSSLFRRKQIKEALIEARDSAILPLSPSTTSKRETGRDNHVGQPFLSRHSPIARTQPCFPNKADTPFPVRKLSSRTHRSCPNLSSAEPSTNPAVLDGYHRQWAAFFPSSLSLTLAPLPGRSIPPHLICLRKRPRERVQQANPWQFLLTDSFSLELEVVTEDPLCPAQKTKQPLNQTTSDSKNSSPIRLQMFVGSGKMKQFKSLN